MKRTFEIVLVLKKQTEKLLQNYCQKLYNYYELVTYSAIQYTWDFTDTLKSSPFK